MTTANLPNQPPSTRTRVPLPSNLLVVQGDNFRISTSAWCQVDEPLGFHELLQILEGHEGVFFDLFVKNPKEEIMASVNAGLHRRVYCIIKHAMGVQLMLRVQPFDLLECTCGKCR